MSVKWGKRGFIVSFVSHSIMNYYKVNNIYFHLFMKWSKICFRVFRNYTLEISFLSNTWEIICNIFIWEQCLLMHALGSIVIHLYIKISKKYKEKMIFHQWLSNIFSMSKQIANIFPINRIIWSSYKIYFIILEIIDQKITKTDEFQSNQWSWSVSIMIWRTTCYSAHYVSKN